MPSFGAETGLIVSWEGFRESVIWEARGLFFLFDCGMQGDIVSALQDAMRGCPLS